MMTVLVAFYEAYPPASGAASVSYNTGKFLRGERVLLQIGHRTAALNLGKGYRLLSFPCRTRNRLAKSFDLMRIMPRMALALRRLRPRAVVLEGASWTVYYWAFLRLIRMLGVKTTVVYHAHNVEYLLRQWKNNRFIARATFWAERSLLRRCDLSTAVSEVDAAQFEKLYGVRPLLLPNGVDRAAFESVGRDDINAVKAKYGLKNKTTLFMGLIDYLPNREALRYLLDRVFPRVVESVPGARLAVIGGSLDEKHDWLDNPGSIPFEEVPAFIRACQVCAAPVFSGSGTRLKILEYLAAGRPVITTTKGAEGLDLTGASVVIADTEDQMVREIVRRLNGNGTNRRPSLNRVVERYSWERIMATFNQTLEERSPERRTGDGTQSDSESGLEIVHSRTGLPLGMAWETFGTDVEGPGQAEGKGRARATSYSAPRTSRASSLRVSIIIATRNRPVELRRLLRSLEAQTSRPWRIVVVDSSDIRERSITREFPRLRLAYFAFPTASASRQRNFGLGKLDRMTDIVGFLDDDALLVPDSLRLMLGFLASSSPRLAGASLNMANHPNLAWRPLKHLGLVERCGLYSRQAGAVVPSGFQTMIGDVLKDTSVRWLPSGAVFWKRAVLDEFRFDEWYSDYSYLEDLDLSYRVGKKYELAVVAGAKYYHAQSSAARINGFRFGMKEVLNRVHFVHKNPELSAPKCLLALGARMGLSFLEFLRTGNPLFLQRAMGNIAGLCRVPLMNHND